MGALVRPLDLTARRLLASALGALLALLLLWLFAVPALPCQAPGGDACPPADDAIHLVPEDALAYVHLNVDPGTEQYQEAAKVASRLPALTDQATGRLLARLPGPEGAPDFERDIAALVRWRGRARDRANRRRRRGG